MVGATIGAVEALKDQGFCRWNYPLRSLQVRARDTVGSAMHRFDDKGSSSEGGSGVDKRRRVEESMGKVMHLSCWGPSTVRF